MVMIQANLPSCVLQTSRFQSCLLDTDIHSSIPLGDILVSCPFVNVVIWFPDMYIFLSGTHYQFNSRKETSGIILQNIVDPNRIIKVRCFKFSDLYGITQIISLSLVQHIDIGPSKKP